MFKKILVPVDGSDSSVMAAKVAADISAKNGGSLTLMYIVRPIQWGLEEAETPEPAVPKSAFESGQGILERIKKESSAPEAIIIVGYGNPAQAICTEAEKGKFDLIVMGSRGIGGLSGSLIGSVSQSVSHMAHCPVLLTRLPKGVKEEHQIIRSMPDDYVIYY